MKHIFRAYVELLKLLPALFTKFSFFLHGLLQACRKGFHHPPRGGDCLNLPPNVHVRADPAIYDQYYLMAQGLSVTWDNPDIQLLDMSGNPLPPGPLQANTDYRVIVRVWNNSFDGPAPGLPVSLSYLSFGIGTTSTPVNSATVDLGVEGSVHCPAFANFVWHTPPIPGHYCLQALLAWPDDANPNNNLGQKNTQVGQLHSPAVFQVTVHNDATVRRHFDFEVDMYRLPSQPPCEEHRLPQRKPGRFAEAQARWDYARRTHGYGRFPVSSDWKVSVNPAGLDLDGGQTTTVQVSIEPAAGTFAGQQAFNLHGFAAPANGQRVLAGGVTLLVQGS